MRKLAAIALAFAACRGADVESSSGDARAPIEPRLQPTIGPVVSQPEPPPPISGGTLALAKNERVAVASDPDRDRIYVVDLALRSVRHKLQLAPRTEPGRVALDEEGHAFVVLRRSGELVTIDLATGASSIRAACIAPRGVAWDHWQRRVLVACASGNIVAFAPDGGDARPFGTRMALDLRDLVVRPDTIAVSTFRSAHMQVLTTDGRSVDEWSGPYATPTVVAWRMRELDAASVVMVAQDPSVIPVRTTPGAYGDGNPTPDCREAVGIVSTRLWLIDPSCSDEACGDSIRLPTAVLPVDVATNGREIVVLGAGNAFTPALPQVFVVPASDLRHHGRQECLEVRTGNVQAGQAIAADFSDHDELVIQTREPAQLHIMTDDRLRTFKTIDLATDSRADSGHAIFHANAGGSLACASCHAEGGDDGHTWLFDGIGPRRTPSLLGTTSHTEPYHWDGDMKDLGTLVDHVFSGRMSGPQLDAPYVSALGKYLFALPPPPQLRADADVHLGARDLFEKKCGVCHSGPMRTNNLSLDVGTRGKFQVPSLVGVAWRGPWIHDGCARTLSERFDPACGGASHGALDDVSPEGRTSLIEYMESL